MSDQTNALDTIPTDADTVLDELGMLKQRATLMGIGFSNNIGVAALRKKIEDKMAGTVDSTDEAVVGDAGLRDPALPAPVAPMSLRDHLVATSMRLIRLRITNLDPKKKDLPGEIITVANEYIGTVRKYIPFGSGTENGYHVPHCLYELLKARQFLMINVRKVNGKEVIDQRWVPEFSLDVLDPLTPAELAKLAAAQAAGGNVE